MTVDTLLPARSQHRQDPPERLAWGAIELSVTNLDRAVRFWTGALGLVPRPSSGQRIALGTATTTLIVLHPGALLPVQRGHAGMYHVALRVPDQAEFSRLLARFASIGLPVSPVDHTMSKAIYVSDPDGHGIEITLETLDRFSHFEGGRPGMGMIDHQGRKRSGRDPLDIPAELALARGADHSAPIADGTEIAHVHFHVPDLESALGWFEQIGFSRNMLLPEFGMADMGASAAYSHRLAVNIWAGKGVSPAPPNAARLLGYHLLTTDPAAFEQARSLLAPGTDGALHGIDPSGTALTLTLV